jgi:hypothetical protein
MQHSNNIEPGTPTQDWSSATFKKSSFSGDGNGACVSVAFIPGYVAIKHSRAAEGTERVIEYTDAEWDAFKKGMAAGEF